MMEEKETIEKRKEKLVKLFGNVTYKKLIVLVLLAVIIYIGYSIRIQPIDQLKDQTTGKYISLELDSTIFLRYAEYIAEHGKLFDVDPMRYYPDGLNLKSKDIGVFTSYFVVYLYKVMHFFSPSVSVQYADIMYPVIAMMILSIFFFLLVKRILDWRVALLATLLINVIPAFIYRSLVGSSDHDILALMFLVITFYVYVVALQAKTLKHAALFGILTGISALLGRASAGSIVYFFTVIGIYNIIEILLNKYNLKDYVINLSWLGMFSLFVFFTGKFGGFKNYVFSVTTFSAYFALLAGTIFIVFFEYNRFNLKDKVSKKIPAGIWSIIISFVLGLICTFLIVGPHDIIALIKSIHNQLFSSFEESRWTTTVAENRKTYLKDWFDNYGKFAVYYLLAGGILLFYKAVRPLKKRKIITAVFSILFLSFMFSRYASDSILNGHSALSVLFLVGSPIIAILLLVYTCIKVYNTNKETYEGIHKIDKTEVMALVWLLVLAMVATTAIRILFEFSLIFCIIVAFFFVSIYDLSKQLKWKYTSYIALLIIAVLLFSPLSSAKGIVITYYNNGKGQAQSTGVAYNKEWQYTGDWVRKNTPSNAVFAHWWDYGYWVQEGFQRATLTDGGNAGSYALNYYMGRNVLTGTNYTDALSFLKAKGATHLLIVSDEIGKYPAFSLIGSDISYDRYSYISTFILDPTETKETRNQSIYVYRGGYGFDDDYVIEDVLFPKGGAGIGAFFVPYTFKENTTTIAQPSAVVVMNNIQKVAPLQCVSIQNQEIIYETYTMGGCLVIIPSFMGQKMNIIGAAIYLSPRIYNSNFARLYILNRKNDYFKLVYDDSQSIPLALYQGSLIGPQRIWEIHYPKDLEVPEEYVKNILLNPDVMKNK